MKSGEVVKTFPFGTKNVTVLESTDCTEMYNESIDRINELIAAFQLRGSGWRFVSFVKPDTSIFKCSSLKG